MHPPTLRVEHGKAVRMVFQSRTNVEQVRRGILEHNRDLLRLLYSIASLCKLVTIDPDRNNELGTDFLPDPFDYLQQETGAVRQIAAIVVGPLVADWRKELGDQVGMGTMNFTPSKPASFA